MDTRTSPFHLRLTRVRDVLSQSGVDALLVPSSDPHLSEYLPERWQGRAWVSGFTGSMGTLVVTRDKAALFADSRYWVQAQGELAGSGIELVRIDTAQSPAHLDWLVAAGAARRRGRGRWPGAGPERGQGAAGAARRGGHHPAHRPRPARRRMAGSPGAAGAAGLRRTARRTRRARAPPSSRWCARRWRGTARPITSSPPWTTSPGSPTCAAATSNTTRCSWRTCCSMPPAGRLFVDAAQGRRDTARRTRGRRHRGSRPTSRPRRHWRRWARRTRCCSTRSA